MEDVGRIGMDTGSSQSMSSIPFAIAAIPVAIYLILMGGLRLRNRPLVTTGWRDTLTLGIAASGLVAIGPMQLFFPADAAARWHGWVWLALLILYLLGLAMVLLSCRPRLIAYGMDEAQFRKTLLAAAQKVDPNSDWQDDVLTMPNSSIQLAMDPSGTSRVFQVVHVGLLHNLQGWIDLERAFVKQGATAQCPRSATGWLLVLIGAIALILAITPMLSDPAKALAQLQEFLDR